jgi:hypothetical protein
MQLAASTLIVSNARNLRNYAKFQKREHMADPRPWLAHYPPGVPAEIDASVQPSIVAMFEATCARHPLRPAY